MMTKLRNQCDTIDHKHTAYLEGQIEKYLNEIQASVSAIFEKTPATVKGKSRLFSEFELHPKTQHLSKYVMELNEAKKKDLLDTPNQSTKLRRMSSKGSFYGNNQDGPIQHWGSGTPGGLKTSHYLTKDTMLGTMPSSNDMRRPKQSIASVNQRAGEVLDIISNDKSLYTSNLEDFQNKIFRKLKSKKPQGPVKSYMAEQQEDPMASLNKKLAAFSLRQRSRDMNRTQQPPVAEHRANDWLSRRPDDFFDLPADTCSGYLDAHGPNVRDLRDFRQKMRERYLKEQQAAAKNRMIYCTH
jgi:hypothetical protein